MDYYNRDDYLSFGGESVTVSLEGIVCLSVKLYCLFPCLSSSHYETSLYVLSQGIPVAL